MNKVQSYGGMQLGLSGWLTSFGPKHQFLIIKNLCTKVLLDKFASTVVLVSLKYDSASQKIPTNSYTILKYLTCYKKLSFPM